jgi:hypothetical protein
MEANRIIQFILAVLHHWAALTGGVVMAVIGFIHRLKNKLPSRKLLIALSVVFFFCAFFFAWEDQFELRQAADTAKEIYKGRSEYNQRRIDKLQDALLTETNKNGAFVQANQSPRVAVKNNSDNFSIHIGEVNNGNIANLQNSPNSEVNQSIVNQSPPPVLKRVELIRINRPSSNIPSAYETVFSLCIENPPKHGVLLRCDKLPRSIIGEPTAQFAGSVTPLDTVALTPIVWIEVTYLTSKKIQESDFGNFTITAAPQKSNYAP